MFELIFIIVIICIIVKKNTDKIQNQQGKYKKLYEKNQNDSDINYNQSPKYNQSFYSTEKVKQYQRQEKYHKDHKDDIDISSDIGYKRCPNCESIVSKKSDVCFMCDYEFNNNEKSEGQVQS